MKNNTENSVPLLLSVLVLSSCAVLTFRWLLVDYRGYSVPGLGLFEFLCLQTLSGKKFYAHMFGVLALFQLSILPSKHPVDVLFYTLLPLTAAYIFFAPSAQRFFASRG